MILRPRFLTALAAGAAATAFPSAIFAQSRKPLAIGYVPSTLFAPIYVAVTKGYLREAGFEPNLSPIVAGSDAMALAAQGQIDLVGAALSAAFFNAIQRGLEVKYVASTGYQPRKGYPSALMVREDLYAGGLHALGSLRGKNIGWNGGAGAASAYYVARVLRPAGLRIGDVQAVNIAAPDQQVALERKAVDAIFTSAPFTELFAQKRLARVIGTLPAGMAGSGVFFGPSLLRDAGAARAVMSALRKASAEISGQGYYTPENLAAYVTYTKQPLDVIKSSPRYDFKPDMRIDVATLADMQREFLADGTLTYGAPLDEGRLIARF
jgi:NitT/TauT family transport system substrate-binding protein